MLAPVRDPEHSSTSRANTEHSRSIRVYALGIGLCVVQPKKQNDDVYAVVSRSSTGLLAVEMFVVQRVNYSTFHCRNFEFTLPVYETPEHGYLQ